MEFLRYFFRANEDGFVLKQFGLVHIILLSIFSTTIYLIANKRFNLSDNRKNRKFLLSLATILIIDQIILYSWQIGSGYFRLDMSLPLYHCRIAAWFFILAIYFNNRLFKSIAIFWGSIGALLAMLIPDLYEFSFPHYTNFNFFIVHFTFGLLTINFLFVEKFRFNTTDLKRVITFTNFYNLALIIVNMILIKTYPDVNYGYLFALPGGYTLFNSHVIHGLIMMLLFNIATIFMYKLFTYKYEDKKIWEISKNLLQH